MGKGWAKGLTALTDPRVALNARTRRGRARGPYRKRPRSEWTWTSDIAYAVGLIATDGSLSRSGRHVAMSSAEIEMLETFLHCIGRRAKISTVKSGYGSTTLRVQVGDVGLYEWLLTVGLVPRKSHVLRGDRRAFRVSCHLVRGLLDGDGSVMDVTYDGTGKARGKRYRTLLVRFVSASRDHITWLQERISSQFQLAGAVQCQQGMWSLAYAKRASLALLGMLYPDANVPCLRRKREVWERFVRES